MPKVNINHQTQVDPDEAFQKIKNFFETDQDIRKIDPKLKMTFAADQRSGKATASQFSAEFQIKASGTGSAVQVVVDLPFILTPLKGKVQETMERKLKKYLA